MSVPELCRLSALELARLLRVGQLSAREVLDAHLTHIGRVNPAVNAIVTLTAEYARSQAFQLDEAQARGEPLGLLHGLPTAHKDLQPTKGLRTTFGSRIFQDFTPEQDSLLVERVRQAGAVLVGKTNTPEFGAGSQTFNEVFGPTLNPWDTTRTCGGSSGGGAVALACHMLPLADGTDFGGSLRNPPSFCNVVGLRPSPGIVPTAPAPLEGTNLDMSTLSVEGPMARNVADLAFYLSALAGTKRPSRQQSLERDFRNVRVAWWTGLGGIPIDPCVRQLVDAQRKVFEALGCIVEPAEPDFTGVDEAFRPLRFLASAVRMRDHLKHHGHLIKETILWEVEQGLRLTARDIAAAETKLAELHQRMRRFMERYEFFVLPVSQVLPFDVRQPYPTEIEGTRMETYIDWMRTCYYISAMGTPAMSVPCGFTAEGLPVGLQLVGRHQADWALLQFARAFEQAAAMPDILPPVTDIL